jgi:GxxExxY protein
MNVNLITGYILDSCIKIHKELGPGLFETVYEKVLMQDLIINGGFEVERQKNMPVIYNNLSFEEGYKVDLIVEKKVIIELKSIEMLNPVHYKQLLTYLRLANLKDGILVNFSVNLLRDGFKRVFNNHVK